jgi:hypothetical protein
MLNFFYINKKAFFLCVYRELNILKSEQAAATHITHISSAHHLK